MILAADLHLRRSTPRARTDDYQAAQERKFRFILEQTQESPPLLVAGDFFHQPRPGEGLLQWIIDLLNEYQVKPIVVPGQHDLPGHSLEQIKESGLGVLAAAGVIDLLGKEEVWSIPSFSIMGVPYGQLPLEGFSWRGTPGIKILLWHHMVINEPLWPGQVAEKAPAILRKYPQFDLIVTGDNHNSFAIADLYGRWLINPGSMMRMTAAQIDHKPCVFKYENNKIEQILLSIEPNVLDLTKLTQEKEKDDRILAFVERLRTDHEIGLSFEHNLVEFLRNNEVPEGVEKIIWEVVK